MNTPNHRQLKRIAVAFLVVLAGCGVIAGLVGLFTPDPIGGTRLDPQTVQAEFQNTDGSRLVVWNGEPTYVYDSDLIATLELGSWEETDPVRDFSATVSITLFDGWHISVDGDTACIYSEYSDFARENRAYFKLPDTVQDSIQALVTYEFS